MPSQNNVEGISFTLGLDPGFHKTGFAIYSKPESRIVSWGVLDHKNRNGTGDVTDNMIARLEARRTRRGRLWYRPARFMNRSRGVVGLNEWIAPFMRSKLSAHLKLIRFLLEDHQIDRVIIEECQFDISQIKSEKTLEGEMYQQSQIEGHDDKKDFVRERDNFECVYCGRKNSKSVDHVLPRKRYPDLKNQLSNMVTACRNCNQEKGDQTASEFGYPEIEEETKNKTEQVTKQATTVDYLNSLLEKWIKEGQLYVEDEEQARDGREKKDFDFMTTRGYYTNHYRTEIGWPKTHRHDASVIATQGKNRRLPKYYLKMRWMGRPSRQVNKRNKSKGDIFEERKPNTPLTITDFNDNEVEIDTGDYVEYKGAYGNKSQRGFVGAVLHDDRIQMVDLWGNNKGGYRKPSGFVKICNAPRLRYQISKN